MILFSGDCHVYTRTGPDSDGYSGMQDTHQEARWAGQIVPAASYVGFDHVLEGLLVVPRRLCQGFVAIILDLHCCFRRVRSPKISDARDQKYFFGGERDPLRIQRIEIWNELWDR